MSSLLMDSGTSKNYRPTIGCDFHNHKVEIEGNHITLQIWDTAGQERYHSLGKAFYRGTEACVLVYDLTNLESLNALNQWMQTFETNAGVDCNDLPYLIVGNKSDMEEARHVREKHLDKWMEEQEEHEPPRVLKYTETSAKTGEGISKAFE